MATINVRKLDDATKKKLQVKAAKQGKSLESYVRDVLTVEADAPESKSGVIFNTMAGKLTALKDYDWDAENTEEIEAWESSTLP